MTTKYETSGNNQGKASFFNNSFMFYQFSFPGCHVSLLVKLKGHYANGVLNTPGLIKTAIWTDECEGIKHIKNFISRYTSSDAGITTSNIYHCDINIRTVKNNV